jgi:hypothetical protein
MLIGQILPNNQSVNYILDEFKTNLPGTSEELAAN